MKISRIIKNAPAGLAASVGLTVAGVMVNPVHAAAPLEARIVLRPLTAVDVETYGLPAGSDYSGGLSTIGIGTPAYLEVEVSTNTPSSDVTSVVWTLTAKPGGSAAVLAASPLGANVPIYEPSSRLDSWPAEPRTVLRPDLVGQYTVTATITAANVGTTNLSQTITAGTYMGVQTCELCHSGGILAPDKYLFWTNTLHARIFSDQIDGRLGSTLRQSCLQCHTTGYDTNALANNGGFDDMAAQHGWTIPTVLSNGNWAAMQTNYPAVANLANVQCESCHGAGSQHALGELSNPGSVAAKAAIAVNYTSGACNQCHDDATHHPYGTQWLNSKHAVTTTDPAGSSGCVGCHTGKGFIQRMDGITNNLDTSYGAINCQACHEPHGETIPADNPHQIRALTPVTFLDGTVVTNAGEGLLCMNCHHARQNAATYATAYHSRFGPHHGPQGDMLEGVNGFTYGQAIPSSAHRNAVTNTCVTCHMQKVASTDPAFLHAGGHTFSPAWETATNTVDLVAACQQCHGPSVTDFDFALQDFDGDGVINGVQTEVQNLLNKLALLLPPVGEPKDTVSPDASWTAPQLEAAYNYLFVQEDGSMGIHNTAYAVGLLKASLASLTGDANHDGLPDAWQLQYFGSINNPNAAPNAVNNSNNMPNWMMYALGLDPTQSGLTVTNGVVWANGKNLVNPLISPGETNTIEIYTAAEVAFNTQPNVTYQIQSISSLSGGWQDVSGPIEGTGAPFSYVTPTRNNVQMFFRVVHTP